MVEKYDLAVYIGRFQPVCKHHLETIRHGLNIANKVLIFVGSANSPRSIKNPFTAAERIEMISSCLSLEEYRRVYFSPKEDSLYDDNQWIAGIEFHVNQLLENPAGSRVALIGCQSDHTSWYLDKFMGYHKEFIVAHTKDGNEIHATDVRNAFLTNSDWIIDEVVPHYVTSVVGSWLRKFRKTPEYETLVEEFRMIREYRDAWKSAPYAPTFVTVDTVVVKSANVLLVRRKASPGKGLLALPGGFVNQRERIVDAAIRELKEETRINVPIPELYGSIKKSEIFDHPDRSLRGRTITHAFYIELGGKYEALPWVKGSDDAEKAMWVPYCELAKMRDQLFEDHWDIINHMVGGLLYSNTPVIYGLNNLNRNFN